MRTPLNTHISIHKKNILFCYFILLRHFLFFLQTPISSPLPSTAPKAISSIHVMPEPKPKPDKEEEKGSELDDLKAQMKELMLSVGLLKTQQTYVATLHISCFFSCCLVSRILYWSSYVYNVQKLFIHI